MQVLCGRISETLSPADLASDLNMSLRTLQHGLARDLGCTPSEFIVAVKMHEAKRRLVVDGAQVQEAARAVGFDDPSHFSRRFKAYYGLTPSTMRDRSAARSDSEVATH